MSAIDHKAEAELAEIHASAMYGTGTDTAYWLTSAQVHATLYAAEQTAELVKQQRIANLIALGQLDAVAGLDPLACVSEPVAADDQADSPWGITASRVLRADIRDGLGLS